MSLIKILLTISLLVVHTWCLPANKQHKHSQFAVQNCDGISITSLKHNLEVNTIFNQLKIQ